MNISELRNHREKIAEEVHNAWWEQKKKQGFHSPISCPNHIKSLIGKQGVTEEKFIKSCEKCHSDMYPYSELPENIKDYDRITVDTVLNAIEKI